MDKKDLRKLIESEIKSILTEEFIEPSEQILKGAMKTFKQQTGINVGLPVLTGKKKALDLAYYTSDMSNQIRGAVMQALFTNLVLNLEISMLKNNIGGYAFKYTLNWTHPTGAASGYDLGVVYYINNTFKWRAM